MKRVGFAGFFTAVISGILTMLGVGGAMGSGVGAAGGALAVLSAFAVVLSSILTPIFTIAGAFIMAGIYFIFAKLLGGQGGFQQFFGVLATVISAYEGLGKTIITAITLALLTVASAMIPAVMVILILLFLISVSIQYVKTLKACFGFGTGKAVIVFLLPIAILAVLAFLLMGAAIMAMIGAMGTGGMGMPMPTGP